jgi:SAM-dependent methyltransferase
MDLGERVALYHQAFPKYPALLYDKGFIVGSWMIGNCYKNNTNYYGAYPRSYLKRIMSLFPDVSSGRILHLFSGSLKKGEVPGVRFDLNIDVEPDIVGNAERLVEYLPAGADFDLILADPPYSAEDAEHYGTPMVNRNKVVSECAKVLRPGGHLCWLDMAFPMYKKAELKLVGTISLIRSTNHRVRAVFIWEKM